MKLTFYTSPTCASRKMCAACRNESDAGQRWREGIAKVFDFDPAAPCPHGIAWGIVLDPKKPLAPGLAPLPETPCEAGPGPGSLIKLIFSKMGIHALPGCGCESFCRKMNGWGWTGCLAPWNMREIVKWFMEKAKERGISARTVRKAVFSAFRTSQQTPKPQ